MAIVSQDLLIDSLIMIWFPADDENAAPPTEDHPNFGHPALPGWPEEVLSEDAIPRFFKGGEAEQAGYPGDKQVKWRCFTKVLIPSLNFVCELICIYMNI